MLFFLFSVVFFFLNKTPKKAKKSLSSLIQYIHIGIYLRTETLCLGLDHFSGLGLGFENTHFSGLGLSLENKYFPGLGLSLEYS